MATTNNEISTTKAPHTSDRVTAGTFRGGDTLPHGTFRGGDTLPHGTFRGGDTLPHGTFRGGDTLPHGTFRGGDTLPHGTFRGSRLTYTSALGSDRYEFEFERQPGGEYRIYIDQQPSYRGRLVNGHKDHRYTSNGRKYICWEGQPLTDLGKAKWVAAEWAEGTQRYIKWGKEF